MEATLDPSVKDLLRYHKAGTEHIKKALSIDEGSSNKEDAINSYKLGIEEFLMGLSIKLKGDSIERGIHIQDKMESNLNMAFERVEELNHESLRYDSLKKKIEKIRIERMKYLEKSEKKAKNSESLTNQSGAYSRLSGEPNNKKPLRVSQFKPSSNTSTSKQSLVRPPSSVNQTVNRPASRPTSNDYTSKPTSNQPTTNAPKNGPKITISKKLKIPNVDDRLVEFILDEIVDSGQSIKFDEVVGQSKAKQALNELVILPALNPELFTGLRSPVKGLLLFGPPGNGKTMLAKAVANEAKCKFFNITAASLTSKYVGESEKLVRALFAVATYIQPSIIFIDEIDSLLFERKENDHESSRRLKTEFLSQFDGMQSNSQDRILVMGATNRPSELDNAALRRFPKRIFISLPDKSTRVSMIRKLLDKQINSLKNYQIDELANLTEGYSGSDLTALAKDASLGPIREQPVEMLKVASASSIRPVSFEDFRSSVNKIRQSTPKSGLVELEKWNSQYGDINT